MLQRHPASRGSHRSVGIAPKCKDGPRRDKHATLITKSLTSGLPLLRDVDVKLNQPYDRRISAEYRRRDGNSVFPAAFGFDGYLVKPIREHSLSARLLRSRWAYAAEG